MRPVWVTAFLDFAPDAYDAGVAFWRAVTGCGLSASRGEYGEFATLIPPEGDAYLRVQRLGTGPDRMHVDLHFPVTGTGEYEVHTSPGGFTFCREEHSGTVVPPAASWPGGRSLVDQVCLDIPASRYDEERAFWQDLTGWTPSGSGHPEFSRLDGAGMPLRLLLQRLDDDEGPVRAHLDLSADDQAAELERHLALGATYLRPGRGWVVLADPNGREYCITGRSPREGMGRDVSAAAAGS